MKEMTVPVCFTEISFWVFEASWSKLIAHNKAVIHSVKKKIEKSASHIFSNLKLTITWLRDPNVSKFRQLDNTIAILQAKI